MGLFKATLLQNQCVLSISKFDGINTYSKLGNYSSPDYNGNCNALVISEGRLATDANFTYLSVGTSFNLSTIFTIDDSGIIRLIGTYKLPDHKNQESIEYTASNFQTNNTYIFSGTQLSAPGFGFSFGPLANKRRWEYEVTFGQLDIFQIDNPGLVAILSYSGFKLNNSLIYDFTG